MSDVLVSHAFVSPKGASSDPTKIDGPKWNAALVHAGGTDGDVAVRDSASSVGASWATRIEKLHVSTIQAGTPANTTETDLWTYVLPAGKLNVDGRALRVTAFGTYAANGNSKILRGYFGTEANLPGVTVTTNGLNWYLSSLIIRTGASAGLGLGNILNGASPAAPQLRTLVENHATAITLKITGQNGTASANDILFRGAVVELL